VNSGEIRAREEENVQPYFLAREKIRLRRLFPESPIENISEVRRWKSAKKWKVNFRNFCERIPTSVLVFL